MPQKNKTRRAFLKSSGQLLGGTWLASNLGMVQALAEEADANLMAGHPWSSLSISQAETMAAVADQIFPPGDSPGATEIGAVYFIDGALAGSMAGMKPLFDQGLADLDQRSPDGLHFSQLSFDEQSSVLQQVESSAFFMNAHFLVMMGLFALPKYGGNRDHLAWELMGFKHQHVWQPPFGYYDEEYTAGGAS